MNSVYLLHTVHLKTLHAFIFKPLRVQTLIFTNLPSEIIHKCNKTNRVIIRKCNKTNLLYGGIISDSKMETMIDQALKIQQ